MRKNEKYYTMKNTLLLIAMSILLAAMPSVVNAQKNEESDYNLRKAYELLENKEEAEALKYINKQIEEYPKSANAYGMRARLLFEQKKYGAALSDINKAIKFWKKDSKIKQYSLYWWRAAIYSGMEMVDKSLEDYETVYKLALKEDPDVIHDVLYQRAEMHFDRKNYDAADADYRLMLKHDEADQVAMIGLTRNLLEREDYKGAIEMANRCEKIDGNYAEIYRFRMQTYEKLGEADKAIEDAIKYYDKAESTDASLTDPIFKKHLSYALAQAKSMTTRSEDVRKWKTLMTTLYELGYDYVNAIKAYNNLEREYGATPPIYYYRSLCYSEIGDNENAIKDINRYIEMGDGNDYYALSRRALIYEGAGLYEKAIADYTTLIEMEPMSVFLYYRRGWCYELAGDDQKAMEDYNAGVDIDKTYPYIFLMRGEQFLKQGKRELASSDFNEILKLDTIAESGSCRHYALLFLDKKDEALEWMEKIISTDTKNKGSYYDKACLMSHMGKLEDAIAALRLSLEKGFRSFPHIEHDDDMDAIRNLPEFISLIEEYKAKPKAVIEEIVSETRTGLVTEVQMKKMYSGVYEVPCTINGLELKFIFDTGASDVTISSVEASFMLKNNYLSKDDIRGKEYFSTATGEIHEGTKINLREIKIGDAVLKNVEASVVKNQQAPLLLGQSVLERFGTITIDNINSKLVIKQ